MEKYLYIFTIIYTYLNHIIRHQLDTIRQASMRHLSDKHHHGTLFFHLQKIDNARKSVSASTPQSHMGLTQSSALPGPGFFLTNHIPGKTNHPPDLKFDLLELGS